MLVFCSPTSGVVTVILLVLASTTAVVVIMEQEEVVVMGSGGSYVATNQSLQHIPGDIPPATTHLDLSENDISTLTRLPTDLTRSLTFLNLSGNPIRAIPPKFFINCSQLLKLDLSGLSLERLEDGVFIGLDVLQGLTLSANQQPILADRDAFRGLGSLTQLNLINTPLEPFPLLGTYMPNIAHLYVSNNSIPDVSCLQGLDQLVEVKLGMAEVNFNGSYRFPPSLRSLSLGYCQFDGIDVLLEAATDLRSLLMTYGPLTRIPPLPRLGGVRQVSFASNDITCISYADLQRIRDANDINLEGNQLSDFPDKFCTGNNDVISPAFDINISFQFPNLDYLNLDANSFQGFPNVSGAPELRRFTIQRNQIFEIPPALLCHLRQVERLDLAGNQLQEVPDFSCIAHDNEMLELSLASNQLVTVQYGRVTILPLLTSLDLGGNHLAVIDFDFLTLLPQMAVLSLKNNLLASLPIGQVPAGLKFVISCNRLSCLPINCWIMSSRNEYRQVASETCHGVDAYANVTWEQLFYPMLGCDGEQVYYHGRARYDAIWTEFGPGLIDPATIENRVLYESVTLATCAYRCLMGTGSYHNFCVGHLYSIGETRKCWHLYRDPL